MLVLLIAVFLLGCSTRYIIPPKNTTGYDYRLQVVESRGSKQRGPEIACWRKPVLVGESTVEYWRRLSTAGWISTIAAGVALCGSGAFGWSRGWTGLGQYSIGLGVLLPVAAAILAPKHGEEKAPRSLLMFKPAVSEEVAIENLTRSDSQSYTTGADGVAIIPVGDIKDWFSGREEIGVWIAPVAAKDQRIAAKVTSTGSVSQTSVEDLSFEMAEVENTVVAYKDFAREYPTSRYVVQAKESTEALSWRGACLTDTKEAYQEFAKEFPQSESVSAVPGHIETLDWKNARQTNTRASYQEFMELHPQSESVAAIPEHIERVDWDSTSSANTPEAYTAFLQVHPNGAYTDSAKRGIEKLDWESDSEANTIPACDDYLHKYHDGLFKTDALARRESLLAEPQKGLLVGEWPKIGHLPLGYATASIVDLDTTDILAALSGDVIAAFPELTQQYQSDLEKAEFQKSAQARNLRLILARRKEGLLHEAFAFRLDSGLPEYSVEHGRFDVALRDMYDYLGSGHSADEVAAYQREAEHVIDDFWFDGLPLYAGAYYAGIDVWQVLPLSVPPDAALSMERRRDKLEVWICFRLTGGIRTFKRPCLSLEGWETVSCVETEQPLVILIDQESGEVVWSKIY
jgi:hypothetical protein